MSSTDGLGGGPARMAAAWSGVHTRLASLRHEGQAARPHRWATRWLHWIAAALLIFAAVVNGEVTNAFRDPSAMRVETWIGVAVVAAYGALWLAARGSGGGSRLPADAPRWERLLSGLVQKGIYLSIAAVLLTGFALAWLAPSDVTVTGPGSAGIQATARLGLVSDAHDLLTGLLGWLVIAHVAGALWHRLVRRDGVLEAISVLPRPARPAGPIAKYGS